MAVYTPIQRKWWFWTIVGIMALPLLVLGIRAIGIAAVDTPEQDVTDWEALSIHRTPSPEPAATPEPATAPKPVLTPRPTPKTTPPPSPDLSLSTTHQIIKETKQGSIQTQTTAPSQASSAYADFLTGVYQAIMNNMDSFNQLDKAMKKNEDLLYDENWLNSMFANVDSMEAHCKEVINYSAVPDRYQAIHDEFKTGCETFLKGLKKYMDGVDLMEGDARVEGRRLMLQALGYFDHAIASLQ